MRDRDECSARSGAGHGNDGMSLGIGRRIVWIDGQVAGRMVRGLRTDYRAYDPRGYDLRQVARMSGAARAAIKLVAVVPALGKISRLLRYRY